MAAAKGNSASVKAYRAQMGSKHTAGRSELKSRASSAGLAAHDSVDAEHRAATAYLNGLSGYSFDTAYVNRQLKDHAKTIDLFNTEIDGGRNKGIRSYAAEKLPHIQAHSIRKAL